MSTIHGDFSSKSDAERAVDALKKAGIPGQAIRVWNIIPESPKPDPQAPSSVGKGALVGGLLGGLVGAGIGAAAGAASDAYSGDYHHMPEVSGVRVVVEQSSAGPDAANVLRAQGASNVG